MDFSLLKTHKPLMALAIASIAILPSLFMGPKVIGIVLLAYVIILVWTVVSIMGRDVIRKTIDTAWQTGTDAAGKKQFGKAGVYFIAFPMMAVGMIVVGINLFVLIFIL